MKFSCHPEVSIILPTFNRAMHLERAIDSVITQTFTDWELLIVDDGSSDHTFTVIEPFITAHPNIRYMKHSNRKAAFSRNAGMQASFGRYLTFLDSDDHYLPEHLASRILLIEEGNGYDLLAGGIQTSQPVFVKDCRDLNRMIALEECIVCGTLFGRRQMFFAVGGFNDMVYAEDTDLWERASTRFRVRKITEPPSYVYERAPDSITLNY